MKEYRMKIQYIIFEFLSWICWMILFIFASSSICWETYHNTNDNTNHLHNPLSSLYPDNKSSSLSMVANSNIPNQQQWDVPKYQNQHSYTWKYGVASLYGLAKPKIGETILDLGCGTGELTNQFYQNILQEYYQPDLSQQQQSQQQQSISHHGATDNNSTSSTNCQSNTDHTNNHDKECTLLRPPPPTTIVVGIDADINMIRKAAEQFPHLIFRHDDMRTFFTTIRNHPDDIIPQNYDLVYSNAALHWLPGHDMESIIRDISYSLKNGGRFVTEFGGYGNVQTIINGCEYATKQLIQQLGQQGQPAQPLDVNKPLAFLSVRSSNLLTKHNITFPYYEQPWYFPKISELTRIVEKYDMEVTFIELYDRPTTLIGHDGIEQWIRMFGSQRLIPSSIGNDETLLSLFFQYVQEFVHPYLYRPTEQHYIADYRRIRMVAIKKEHTGEKQSKL